MVGFGTPAPTRAAGTYVKLLVKTAKYIRPFSKYDGITGQNEEEYLVDFNTAFKVTCAAAVQPIDGGITRSNNSPRLTRVFIPGEGRALSQRRVDVRGFGRKMAAA